MTTTGPGGPARARRRAKRIQNRAIAAGLQLTAEEALDVAALEKLIGDLRGLREEATPGEAARIANAEVLAYRQIQSLRQQAAKRPVEGEPDEAELVKGAAEYLRGKGWKLEPP